MSQAVSLPPGVTAFSTTRICGLEHISFGQPVIIDDFVFLYATDEHAFGNYVHVASFTSITGGGRLYVEDFAGISSGCRILTGSDDFFGGGLTNPTVPADFRSVTRGVVRIGRHALIGANSVILPDVTIGEGCAVGAGSVVTQSLEPWGVYVGTKRICDRPRKTILAREQELLAKMNRAPR